MVSIKEIDITIFNHFAQKKCINHQRRKAYSVCLHEDCWNSESDKVFFCGDCNMDHIKKHGNSLRFDALFTDELFDEFDDYMNNQNIKDKLKERISKFWETINESHREVEQFIRCQFAELKRFFESHLIETDYCEDVQNLKKVLSKARIDLSLNYEFKEKIKTYCTQIQKIQNNLNEIINAQVISESQKDYDKIDVKLNLKLEKMVNDIKENVKNQVDQLNDNLIDCNKKNKSFRNELAMREISISEIKEVGNTSKIVKKN